MRRVSMNLLNPIGKNVHVKMPVQSPYFTQVKDVLALTPSLV